ncbi:hypothetical protein P154DRAFT_531466 [Amniculicola lignicola CBS 123094]|uniref:RRM domain-containing protein n=1 Tax=Amniculicola lignicola CBS 123094 TaxID=1392246 RepID=A0A6A5X1V8_9PLEO|nr:hypothetical protein P154DRAFT_531466 [Amniculicola lignicola CBS 123094]
MTSVTPESSRTRAGPASSPPSGGTALTFYSPDLTRSGNRGEMSAKKAGKQKAVDTPPMMQRHGFANELQPGTDTFVSRYLVIDGYPAELIVDHRLQVVEERMKQYACFLQSVPLVTREVIRLRFDDLEEACEAHLILTQLNFVVRYITQHEFAGAKFQDVTSAMEFEGQIEIVIRTTPTGDISERDMFDIAHRYARFVGAEFGKVHDHVNYGCATPVSALDSIDWRFRVEMKSVDAANRAVQHASAYPYGGEVASAAWLCVRVRHWLPPTSETNSNSSTPPFDRYGRLTGYRLQPLFVPARHPSDAHNRVRKERILDGSDVRTTVMLRNIPNKMDKLELKALLDRICFGRFDFVYLRIDFSTASNVGYAFINVTDMTGLLAIVQHLDGHAWAGYRTAKAAEISYATIQGKEALEQKFRNSSVMQEAPFCRPAVFMTYERAAEVHTQATALGEAAAAFTIVGTQIAFPPPDNPAKLQRSMDSARQVGLYPPHGAGAGVDHRNRSSIWDRGTPRDLQVAVMHPAGGLPEIVKRSVEMWFAHRTGQFIQFEAVPLAQVHEFIQQHPWMFANAGPFVQPGVIGQRPSITPGTLIMAPPNTLPPAHAGHINFTE